MSHYFFCALQLLQGVCLPGLSVATAAVNLFSKPRSSRNEKPLREQDTAKGSIISLVGCAVGYLISQAKMMIC